MTKTSAKTLTNLGTESPWLFPHFKTEIQAKLLYGFSWVRSDRNYSSSFSSKAHHTGGYPLGDEICITWAHQCEENSAWKSPYRYVGSLLSSGRPLTQIWVGKISAFFDDLKVPSLINSTITLQQLKSCLLILLNKFRNKRRGWASQWIRIRGRPWCIGRRER